MMVIFCIVHLLASEYITAQPSKGEVLVFRGRESSNTNGGHGEHPKSTPMNSAERPPCCDTCDPHTEQMESSALVPSQARMFCWKNLNYDIQTGSNERKILHDVHGWVKPGTLTALMVNWYEQFLQFLTDCLNRESLVLAKLHS